MIDLGSLFKARRCTTSYLTTLSLCKFIDTKLRQSFIGLPTTVVRYIVFCVKKFCGALLLEIDHGLNMVIFF